MERISSRQNGLVKRFREVAGGDPGDEWMLLDGDHLVVEAFASGLDIDVLAITEPLMAGRLEDVARELEHRGTRIAIVSQQVIGAMSPVRQPPGVTAIARRPRATIEQVLGRHPALVVVVNEIQDPGNVGAIVRAAEGCGATGIVVTTGSADPFGWKALRGGMGSTFRMAIAAGLHWTPHCTRPGRRTSGHRHHRNRRHSLPACDLRADCAILLGAEGPGLPRPSSPAPTSD